ncbi:MAG: hypothetical protein ACLQVY_08110 [Limisphaerales bacterium]
MLILIGLINLVKLFRNSPRRSSFTLIKRPIIAQPFLLGMVLAAGFETASQFSALILAGETNPWLLGAIFTGGMAVVDGFDGYLAAFTQNLAATGEATARKASQLLGVLVVLFSFGLGGAELLGADFNRLALPVGLTLFATVIGIRFWARSGSRPVPATADIARFAPTNGVKGIPS